MRQATSDSKFWYRLFAILSMVCILLPSCRSTTVILSEPPGATVFVNNERLGKTPCAHSDASIATSTNQVVVKKSGYKDLYTSFSRDERVHVGAAIAGLFFYIPWLWVLQYEKERTYYLEPEIREDEYYMDSPSTEQKSKAERLREMKELLDEGILTQEEFDAEKKKILKEE